MPNRTLLAAIAILAAGTAATRAADLPSTMPAPAPAPAAAPLPTFTWTGAYFGANAGAGFGQDTRFRQFPLFGAPSADDRGRNGLLTGARPVSETVSDDGFAAGAQVGYNHQFGGYGGLGGVVLGVEADADYLDGGRTSTYVGADPANGAQLRSDFRSGVDFLGTVRGRLGYAFDRALVYGTGGFAYGDTFQSTRFYTEGNPSLLRFQGSRGGLQAGYAYGGGVEYALPTGSFLSFMRTSGVTMKAEYLHYDLGEGTLGQRSVSTTSIGYGSRTSTEGDLVRLGLNYKY